jgi:hypothetical protein
MHERQHLDSLTKRVLDKYHFFSREGTMKVKWQFPWARVDDHQMIRLLTAIEKYCHHSRL